MMAWRFDKQPNGLLAVFSDIVDDFTFMNNTKQNALLYCTHKGMSEYESLVKVEAGINDLQPWKNNVRGDGLARWRFDMKTIAHVHGKEVADDREQLGNWEDDE